MKFYEKPFQIRNKLRDMILTVEVSITWYNVRKFRRPLGRYLGPDNSHIEIIKKVMFIPRISELKIDSKQS